MGTRTSLPELPGLESAEVQARSEPWLAVPETRTALPAIDRALPTLHLFARVVGRHWARYKIALLKELQENGAGRWRINEIKQNAWWLEPASVTELVAELREAGALIYEPVRGYYRLSSEARVVAAVLDALTIPEVEPRRMIKFFAAAINLGLAGGAGGEVVIGGFRAAVSVLRGDVEELIRLADDGSYSALLEAADVVREHVDDMDKLLKEHERFRIEHSSDRDFMDLEYEALSLCAKLGDRAADVIAALTDKADELMQGGARLDRGDIREFVEECDRLQLAGMVDELVGTPPFIPFLSASDAFHAFLEKLGHVASTPPPLPAPTSLLRVEPPRVPDPMADMAAQLWALKGPTSIAELVIGDAWPASTQRYGVLMETIARRGRQLPSITLSEEVEEPRSGGVWRISRTTVEGYEHAADA